MLNAADPNAVNDPKLEMLSEWHPVMDVGERLDQFLKRELVLEDLVRLQ